MHMTNKTNASKTILLLGLLILNVCSGKKSGKITRQWIVKFNEKEVSIHQVNFVLSPTDGINQDNVEIAKKQILNALIEEPTIQGLRMDCNPEIMMVIQQTNRQMLAQAWLDKVALNINKSTMQGIEQNHQIPPKLVAKHNTFKLKEILISKVDVKGKDEAFNKGVKGLFP